MKLLLTITLFLTISLSPTYAAGDKSSGAWNGESMAREMMSFISNLRNHFDQRRQNLETMGEKIKFPPRYGEALNEDQKKYQEKFVAGRLSTNDMYGHMQRYYLNAMAENELLAKYEEKYKGKELKKNLSLNKQTKMVFESEVSAGKICVILDVSGSMDNYTDRVKSEIKKGFPEARVIEINGSSIEDGLISTVKAAWYFSDLRLAPQPFEKDYHYHDLTAGYYFQNQITHNNFTAMVAMSEIMRYDTIYWFSDFKDKVNKERAEELQEILVKNKTQLILHTMKRSPKAYLRNIVKATGGAVIKVRWDKLDK